jgi:ATP-dependent DNA ligase
MIIPTPMPLGHQSKPFDDPDWLYEIKHDGFRALAVIEDGRCRFFSKNKHRLTGFRDLGDAIVKELNVDNAVLDGELAATDELGRTVFEALMHRSRPMRYFTFDLVWLNGRDLRSMPLLARKRQLKQLLPARSAHMLLSGPYQRSGYRIVSAGLSVRSRRDCGKEGGESLWPECERGRVD